MEESLIDNYVLKAVSEVYVQLGGFPGDFENNRRIALVKSALGEKVKNIATEYGFGDDGDILLEDESGDPSPLKERIKNTIGMIIPERFDDLRGVAEYLQDYASYYNGVNDGGIVNSDGWEPRADTFIEAGGRIKEVVPETYDTFAYKTYEEFSNDDLRITPFSRLILEKMTDSSLESEFKFLGDNRIQTIEVIFKSLSPHQLWFNIDSEGEFVVTQGSREYRGDDIVKRIGLRKHIHLIYRALLFTTYSHMKSIYGFEDENLLETMGDLNNKLRVKYEKELRDRPLDLIWFDDLAPR